MEITPYTRMVFYHETDRMDIVNHSNYIHMAEEARVDFMEKIGIGYSRMEEQGIMFWALPVSTSTPCTSANILLYTLTSPSTTALSWNCGMTLSVSKPDSSVRLPLLPTASQTRRSSRCGFGTNFRKCMPFSRKPWK